MNESLINILLVLTVCFLLLGSVASLLGAYILFHEINGRRKKPKNGRPGDNVHVVKHQSLR